MGQEAIPNIEINLFLIFSPILSTYHLIQPALALVTGSSRKYLWNYTDSSYKVYVQNIGPINNPIKIF